MFNGKLEQNTEPYAPAFNLHSIIGKVFSDKVNASTIYKVDPFAFPFNKCVIVPAD